MKRWNNNSVLCAVALLLAFFLTLGSCISDTKPSSIHPSAKLGRRAGSTKNADVVQLSSSDAIINELKQPKEGRTYVLKTSTVQLQEKVTISVSNVAIVGAESGTKVICPPKAPGFVVKGKNVTFERLELSSCDGGAALTVKPATASKDGGYGGASIAGDGDKTCDPTVFVKNCNFSDNTEESKPALLVKQTCVEVKESFFVKNTAVKKAGAGIGASGGGVIIDNVTFADNRGEDGAAVNVKQTNVWVLRSYFLRNTADVQGGAIFADVKSNLWIDDSKFIKNVAESTGGAIKVQKNSSLTAADSEFQFNTASDTAGAVASAASQVTFLKTDFTGNYATNRAGAAEIYSSSTASLESCSFAENGAGVGGAIWQETSSVTVIGSTFSGNVVQRTGGALYVIKKSDLTIKSSLFSGNRAFQQGGAVYALGISQLAIRASNFSHNHLIQLFGTAGGGIWVSGTKTTIEDSRFESNHATGEGGAVEVNGQGDVTIKTSTFLTNEAKRGGAISVYQKATVTIKASQFTSNHAKSRGGGLHADATKSLTVEDSTFRNNSAFITGAAVKLANKCAATIEGSTFEENFAFVAGGAFSALTSTATVSNSSFSGNWVKEMEDGEDSGGAFHLHEKSDVTLTAVTLYRNSASKGGAAIIVASKMVLENSVVRANNATKKGGGGAQVDADSSLTAKNVKFLENVAATYGGGIVGNKATLELDGVSFLSNTALSDGGGAVEVHFKSNVTIANSQFIENVSRRGGAVTHSDSELTVSRSRFESNAAFANGGAFFSAACKRLTIKKCYFVKNAAYEDGGALAAYKCTLMADKVRFRDNYATLRGGAISWKGDFNLTVGDAMFYANSATDGGALDLQGSRLIIQNSRIGHNEAGDRGGGLILTDGAFAKMVKTELAENVAFRGGAIHLSNSKVVINDTLFVRNSAIGGGAIEAIKRKSNVTLSRSNFTENSAQEAGGAIYLESGHLHVDGTRFVNNSAIVESHNGENRIYDYSRSAYTLNSDEVAEQDESLTKRLILLSDGLHETNHQRALQALSPLKTTSGTRRTLSDASVGENSRTNAQPAAASKSDDGQCFGVRGGGIAAICPKKMVIDKSVFSQNIGVHGGALGLNAGKKADDLQVRDTIFEENSAFDGGAVYLVNGLSAFELSSDVVLKGNAAARGGGISLSYSAALEVISEHGKSLRIEQNAAFYGGGLFCYKCHMALDSPVEFFDNLALERGGGAYFLEASYETAILQAVFDSNAASFGGGLAFVDCENFELGSEPDSIYFRNNTALIGGGVHIQLLNITQGDYQIRQSRVLHNEARDWKSMISSKTDAPALGAWQQLAKARVEGEAVWPTCYNCTYGTGGGVYIDVRGLKKTAKLCVYIENFEAVDNEAVVGDDGMIETVNKNAVFDNVIVHSAYICVG